MVEITKKINLPNDLPDSTKEEIGSLVVNEILRFTAEGKSPVSKEKFSKLDKKYADKEHKGDRTPRLRLEGDMMESLGYKIEGGELIVGIMDAGEQDKADGHNNFSGKSKLPRRRFIPAENQNFKRQITTKINSIISDRARPDGGSGFLEAGIQTEASTAITAEEILGQNAVDALFGDIF